MENSGNQPGPKHSQVVQTARLFSHSSCTVVLLGRKLPPVNIRHLFFRALFFFMRTCCTCRQYPVPSALSAAQLAAASSGRAAAVSAAAAEALAAAALNAAPSQLLADCVICGESVPPAGGIRCQAQDPHFVCDDCFNNYVIRWVMVMVIRIHRQYYIPCTTCESRATAGGKRVLHRNTSWQTWLYLPACLIKPACDSQLSAVGCRSHMALRCTILLPPFHAQVTVDTLLLCSQLSPESRVALARRKWALRCALLSGCEPDLQQGYRDREVAAHVSDETFAQWLAAREEFAADVVRRLHDEQVRLICSIITTFLVPC